MRIGDRLISLGWSDPIADESLSITEKEIDRQDCPELRGSYLDPFSLLLRPFTKIYVDKAKQFENKVEGLSSIRPLTGVQRWSRFVIPLHESLPRLQDDRKSTQCLLFAGSFKNLWIYKGKRKRLRYNAASTAIRVHIP